MRLTDLLVLPLAALWQQKRRTILTTLGVVFGAFVLAASLSIGQGVQETINRISRQNEISRKVEIFPKWNNAPSKAEADEVKVEGAMTDDRRERIRKALAEQNKQSTNAVQTELNRDVLRKLAAIPHVKQSIPFIVANGFALLGKESQGVSIYSGRPDDEIGRKQIVAGRYFDAPDQKGLVLSEVLAYRLGLVNDADVRDVIGKPLRLEFRTQRSNSGLGIYLMKAGSSVTRDEQAALDKVIARLPEALEKLDLSESEARALRNAIQGKPAGESLVLAEDYPVIGVIRRPIEEEQKNSPYSFPGDSYALLPYQTAADFYFRGPGNNGQGVNQVVLFVDDEQNVKDVVKRAIELGVEARAATEFIERERLIYLLIFGGMTCVAAVALLVSALGITNTMLMSVLERTREIGIMKAVGADNRHLMFVFLVEGGLIGLLGGLIGLLLAWSASFPGDAWVQSFVMRDIKIDLKGSIFVFPPWIGLSVVIFTLLVTTLAAVYPARHAARIDPVKALRHE